MMTEQLLDRIDTAPAEATHGRRVGSRDEAPERQLEQFLSVLSRMSVEERISASRHGGFTRAERTVWAARYPEEVPLVNGEFEWIALGSADVID
jgi:hypothetical protein